MPKHTPSERRKNVSRLGGAFGGLLGSAVKALKGQTKPAGQKGKKRRKTRQQILDEI